LHSECSRGLKGPLAPNAVLHIAFPVSRHGRHTEVVISELHTWPVGTLSTLRPHPYEPRRMTRSQDGALLLSCAALSSATPCRFISAHPRRPLNPFRNPCIALFPT